MGIFRVLRASLVVRVLGAAALLTSAASQAQCPAHGGKFEPGPGQVLHIVGQTDEYEDSYIAGTGITPGGSMSYRQITDLVDPDHLRQLQYPNTAWQIGLNLLHNDADLKKLGDGGYDAQIAALGLELKAANRPIYLRIGYEFDGPHNKYSPDLYIAAYRRIVNRLRFQGVTNVAFVWHSYALSIYQGGTPAHDEDHPRTISDEWYPGDSYVDWIGVSVFFHAFPTTVNGMVRANAIADFAEAHGKPLMISESTPSGRTTPPPVHGDELWDSWYARVIAFINARNVKVWSYINDHWNERRSLPTTPSILAAVSTLATLPENPQDVTNALLPKQYPDWGDARVEANPTLLALWLDELNQPKYLKTSPSLFCSLGYPSTATYETTDYLDDFSNVPVRSLWLQVDKTIPASMGGDTARLKRTMASQEFVTWRVPPKTVSVSAKTYFYGHTGNFTIAASNNGLFYTAITPTITTVAGDWTQVRYTANVPAGTTHVRMTFPNSSAQTWTPQLGQVTFTSQP